MNIRLSTARTIVVGPILAADGTVYTTTAVATVLASKEGGNPTALNGTATLAHKQAGFYLLALTATDTNTLGCLEISLNDDPRTMPVVRLNVLTQAAYDALHAASGGVIPANSTQLAGQTVTAAAGVTFPGVIASPTNITGGTITTVSNQLTAAAIATAVWGALTSGITTANSIGKRVLDFVTTLVYTAPSGDASETTLQKVLRLLQSAKR